LVAEDSMQEEVTNGKNQKRIGRTRRKTPTRTRIRNLH